ncbi:cleavage stimulating factor 64 [Malania oleifera]|uniref:cleavage stimulating factor 64 n=1 Tax=Malania oleifera TaxID=397392 RepID=UPI0025AE1C2D|nr:cleavage stimulating factor 64 [Malania oleifera]
MASSQHRCVFVGNIPYDATEEQLIQICEEVGPVVSFRLVIDRETGKPKGYGFCEYKDEETALSARRNLQGYEINGRQLRVDFAENDKGSDRNREQGRGGPGMVANADIQKQIGGPVIHRDSAHPIGLPVAMAAASVMAGTLGGAQTGSKPNQNGLQNQLGLGSDPLTLHLAKMSRNQLNEIMYELKVMTTENRDLARQLLLANPHLPKALFQAQIMLGMVSPQMLHLPNIQQAPGSFPRLQDGQQVHQSSVQTLPGLPPLAQNKIQFGLISSVQDYQMSSVSQNSLVPNQFSAVPQALKQPQIQLPQVVPSQVQQTTLPVQSRVSTLPSIRPQPSSNLPVRPQIQLATSSSLKEQMQAPLLQHLVQVGVANIGQSNLQAISNAGLQPSSICPPSSEPGFQPSSHTLPSIMVAAKKDADRSARVTDDAARIDRRNNSYASLPLGKMARETSEPINRPSKLVKLDDGSGTSGTGSLSVKQLSRADEGQQSEKQVPQSQLLPEVDSALLQQVMNLTPEQLSSLPPEQQQEVIQLQQMLR